MAANQRQFREDSHLPKEGWSSWVKAMVPLDPGLEHRRGLEHRGGPDQVGLICSSIRDAFSNQARHCGIYEWRAKGTKDRQPNHVVYLGSTCRGKVGALRARILEYCTNGSHKRDLINDVLRGGYELWVRVKIAGGRNPREKAENMENELLAKYDYAWNIRDNGERRNILPRSQHS